MNLAPKTVTSVSPEKLKVSVFLTNHYQLQGEVLLTSSDRCQLSDLLNKSQPFLPVANAQMYNCDGQLLVRYPFICLNRQTIQLIILDITSYNLFRAKVSSFFTEIIKSNPKSAELPL
jgi:hypothetical protein